RCLLQRNVKHRAKKKLVFYAIFVWGCAFIISSICVIKDSISATKLASNKIVRLTLGNCVRLTLGNCSLSEKEPFTFYGIKSVCVIGSICLSFSTALKIARCKKQTSFRLTDSESKRYNDNKEWFNLYLKLFIMLFITMSIN
ncbi:uncharacterized protein LOC114934831, partial [Nylanderia fulva]|uniref:uncharacterized protein LOC114934831 n=1 Tax=Nylanderia fulva TaxID=613905 RepID=UPI0010FBA663